MLLLKLAPVWACFLLCFLLARVAAGCKKILPDWRLSWILATLATGVFLVLNAEIAGAFHSLDRPVLAIIWIGEDAFLFWMVFGKFKAAVAEMAAFKEKIRDFDKVMRWIYGLGSGFGLLLGVISAVAPPFVWDCKTYHVPRILNWVQDKSLQAFPTADVRRVAYDPGAEIASTNLYLLDGSDWPINLPSWFSMLTSAILASYVTEILIKLVCERTRQEWPQEKARLAAAFSFLLVLTIPEGIIQAISTENDFVAAMCNLALASMTVLFLRNPGNLPYAAAMGVSLALGICTKASTFISAAPFVAGAFGLLAWRRLYRSALKLGAILVIAVTLINAPWFMRNYQVFGHPLGPASISTANVNPSFSPDRDIANIIRNLSLYTATPSATVTTALDNLVSALISWTGRPLNDPTSVVPYQDSNQFTHFYLTGPSRISNGDGFGNIHFWLILAAFVVILGFPLRNALGFYAACICAGFCLSCSYLRWHPWLYRYHMTYFVLAMPVVGMALGRVAHRKFILFIALLCLANAGLILAYDPQFPIYTALFKVSREESHFGADGRLQDPYAALAEDIIARGCTNVLVNAKTYSFDYGLWVCLQDRGYHGTIEEFLVQNETARLRPWEMTPRTAMVFIGNNNAGQMAGEMGGPEHPLLEIGYYYATVTALFSSRFSGNWTRMIGPDNHAELSFDLSVAKGIGPEKPAEVHFSCDAIDHEGRPLTNNVLRLVTGDSIRDFDLRSGPVRAMAIATQSSFSLKTFLLQPVLPPAYPAYLSNVQLICTWLRK